MKEIWSIGEPLVEIMRPGVDQGLDRPGEFLGPFASGAPAIFIDAVAKLGRPCGFIGTVGDDAFGRCIEERLRADGVDCRHLGVSDSLSTGVAFVAYDSDGERTFIYHIGNAAAGEIRLPAPLPGNVGIFHIMGCSLMPSPEMAAAIVKAARHYAAQGSEITFDPNIRVESLRRQSLQDLVRPIMERCSVFMPGVSEMLMIAEEESLEAAAAKLFRNPVLKVIALKRGAKGCTIITREESFDVPAYLIEARDPTGAGDCFDAGFLCAYLDGQPFVDCARLGSAAAAINTAAFGPMEGDLSVETARMMMEGGAR